MTSRQIVRSIALLFAVPTFAGAQIIRGTATDQSGAPIPGVVILMLDARDSVAARALSNESGDFRVAAGVAGVYRLRTMRVGFRPTVSTSITVGQGQELVHQLQLAGLPFALDTIRVADRNPCRTPSDTAAAVFAIWEQVRTALTATQLTQGTRAIRSTFVTFQRELEPNRERVVSQSSMISSGLGRGVWASPSADSLRRAGYVVTNRDGTTTYWAPDLPVLLSNAFIEDNCFRLASSRDPRLIGITFEPNRERRGVAAIRGTLWVDRRSSELRRLEYRYTNATKEQEFGSAGGTMEFARTKNNAWVISGWNIRMPMLEQLLVRSGSAFGAGATVPETRVMGIKVEGGALSLVRRDLDTLWARTPLVLAGTLLDSLSGDKVTDARVVLRGTGLATVTDAEGRFRIRDVLPGEYMLDIRSRSLAAIGASHSVPVMFTDSSIAPTIRVPSARQVASPSCTGLTDGMIAGSVQMRGDTLGQRNVKVVAEWNESTGGGRRLGVKEARTDGRGGFRLCGIPLGADVTLRTQTDSSAAQPVTVRIPTTERFASVELMLDPNVVGEATLSGIILSDINAQPIADVEVAIPELSKNVFTGPAGAFRLNDIPAGTHRVVARKVGYKELVVSIAFAGAQTVERPLVLSRVATLDTIAVTSQVNREFEENRKLGIGRFMTRTEIDKLQGQPIGNSLSQMSAVGLIRGRNGQGYIVSTRESPRLSNMQVKGPSEKTGPDQFDPDDPAIPPNVWCPDNYNERAKGLICGCYAKVYLDNALMNPPERQGRARRPTSPFDVNSIPSQMIEAVEWYSNSAQMPVKYGAMDSSCGVLVIHSRKTR